MQRYKALVDYHGGAFNGWQIQPDARSVQEELQEALSTFCHQPIAVVGCGRTDAGVHARNYPLHFETHRNLSSRDLKGINAILPSDISMSFVSPVSNDFHARYSCYRRTYHYFIHFRKSVFEQGLSFHYPLAAQCDVDDLNAASELMIRTGNFYTFCKSKSGVDNYECSVDQCQWSERENGWQLKISSNRFLRGMVRMTVGMCLNVALGKISLIEVKKCLQQQQRLDRPWSVPAEGLFLVKAEYPESLV